MYMWRYHLLLLVLVVQYTTYNTLSAGYTLIFTGLCLSTCYMTQVAQRVNTLTIHTLSITVVCSTLLGRMDVAYTVT